MATDAIDGTLARHWDVTSQIGAVLDTTADKVFVIAILLWAALRARLPWPQFWIIVASFLIVLIEGIIYVGVVGEVPIPNLAARVAAMFAAVFVLYLVAPIKLVPTWPLTLILLGLNCWHIVSAVMRIVDSKVVSS
jgi:phosphatidylglycerophosphate synthase